MLFTPRDHGLWDTWIFPHQGRYHLFWLQTRGRVGMFDSIGHAVSSDLIHWDELGTVIERSPSAKDWLGTGRTWFADGRFHMNFSEFEDGVQVIRFARSDDPMTWRRDEAAAPLRGDPRWYPTSLAEVPDQWVRWDTLVPIAQPDGSWRGLISAVARFRDAGAAGAIASASSRDGVAWLVGPPASAQPRPLCEVSGHIAFGDRHYAIVGTLDEWGGVADARAPHALPYNGMSYWCADRAEGPYAPPTHGGELHGARTNDGDCCPAYFGTVFRAHDGRMLWNHQWVDHHQLVWLETIKELVEESPGRLALRYWDGLEALMGERLIPAPTLPPPETHGRIPGRPTAGRFAVDGVGWSGSSPHAAALATFASPDAARAGCLIEATLEIGDCAGAGAGLFFGGDPARPAEGIAIRVSPDGTCSVGRACMGRYDPRLSAWETFSMPALSARRARLRAIVRGRHVEFYLDDRLARTLRLKPDESFTGRIGLLLDGCEARVSQVSVWALAMAPLGQAAPNR